MVFDHHVAHIESSLFGSVTQDMGRGRNTVFKIDEASQARVARKVHDALTGRGDIVIADLLAVLGIPDISNSERALRVVAEHLPVPQGPEPPPPEPEYVSSDHEGGHE